MRKRIQKKDGENEKTRKKEEEPGKKQTSWQPREERFSGREQ